MLFIIKVFLIGFFLNLLYEILHSLLYTTCLEATLEKYVYLILKGGIFDGIAIATIYYATNIGLPEGRLITNPLRIAIFMAVAIAFAYAWEIYSLRKGKWKYSARMPLFLGVGATPLVQLAITGITSIYLAIYFQV